MADVRELGEVVYDFAHGTDPVRWWVIDDVAPRVPADAVPPGDWPGWEARYDNDCERGKRATRRADLDPRLAGPMRALGSRPWADLWSGYLGYPVEPDPTGHGRGLHVTAPGGWLNAHLDFDRHPRRPAMRLALSAVLFLHDRWEPGWGGAFYLASPAGEALRRFEPLPGRLVAFEASDLAYHGVEAVTGPAERVSVAAGYLAPATPASTRTRALFLPSRGPR